MTTVVGLAEKMEEIYLPGDKTPLFLDKNSSSLRLLMQVRNEAHRFGLAFHRKKRDQSMAHSVLLEIPGVGLRTMEKLLVRFGSVATIASANQEELAEVVSGRLAGSISTFFKTGKLTNKSTRPGKQSGYRIVAPSPPRVATEDSFYR